MKRITTILVMVSLSMGILSAATPVKSMERFIGKTIGISVKNAATLSPATLWQLYECTGDPSLLNTAEAATERLMSASDEAAPASLALFVFGNAYRLTGREDFRHEVLEAGKKLASCPCEKVMELELLTLSSALTGKPEHYRLAKSYADRLMEEEVLARISGQKGRALPELISKEVEDLYGFTMMYRQTADRRYLTHAVKIGRGLLEEKALLHGAASAEAVATAASAFVELATYTEGETGPEFLDRAGQLIRGLASTGCGEYHYVEALGRYRRLLEGRPVVEVLTLSSENEDRALWISHLDHMARPLLLNLSRNTLKKNMTVESSHYDLDSRRYVTHLEALGRLAAGMGPWLELGPDESIEGRIRAYYIELLLAGIRNGMDPASPDHLNFTGDKQPLVDAAFLVQGLLRARTQVLARIDEVTMERLVDNLRSTRTITPNESNWLLFSAMVECFLKETTGEWDFGPVRYALDKHAEWYKGDGMYGDGPEFHMDYYNSYVIQPMLLQALEIVSSYDETYVTFRDKQRLRYGRYGAILEKLISPEATIPAVGRSLPYRCGALQALSDAAYLKLLPAYLTPAQVRSAVTAVIDRQMNQPGTYDSHGWLTVGFAGHQPKIAEEYISTGSLYLCSTAFVALGLAPEDPFWAAPAEEWTQKKVWKGEDLPGDHALWE